MNGGELPGDRFSSGRVDYTCNAPDWAAGSRLRDVTRRSDGLRDAVSSCRSGSILYRGYEMLCQVEFVRAVLRILRVQVCEWMCDF